MKKNYPIKHKLVALCSFFLLIIIGGNLFQMRGIIDISSHLDDVTAIQLPAIHKMTLVDMHHDGLMGIVYKSLYVAGKNDEKLNKEVQDEFSESSKEMKSLISEIEDLKISDKTKKAIKETTPAIESYIKLAGEIIQEKTNGKSVPDEKIEEFNKNFSYLEEHLSMLSSSIESDAKIVQASANESAKSGKMSGFIIIAVALVIGISFSWFIVVDLMKSIADAIEILSASVHDVQNSSQKVDIISNQLHRSVEAQISSITQSASALDEISAMLQNNTMSAENAKSLSSTTKGSAEKGKEEVSNVIREVQDISLCYDEIERSLEDNNKEISKIVDLISEITSKTQVINDIVFQTKLLSFNASVEAARAGEAGKGFAVVAEEVAKLASSSGEASNEISQMLSASQEKVKSIADFTKANINVIVQKGRKKVESGNSVALECNLQLDKILECAQKLDISVNEISNAIVEQNNGVKEVNSAMKVLENATHETTTISSNSKESSESLKEQAHKLRYMIQQLRKVLGAKKSYDVSDSNNA